MGRHLENVVLAPSKFTSEGVLSFPIPWKPVKNKPIVVMVPSERVRESGLEIPKEVAEKYQPDYGVVYATGGCMESDFGMRVKGCDCPGCCGLKYGDLVAVKPYTGAWFTHKDEPWIPEGRIVKILGSATPWYENILCVVEP